MAQVKERGGGGEERKEALFPSFPLPPLSFFGSCFISRAAKTENPVPLSFFAPKPNGNACYAGYPLILLRNAVLYFRLAFLDAFAADKQRHPWPLHNHIARTSLRPGGNKTGLSAVFRSSFHFRQNVLGK